MYSQSSKTDLEVALIVGLGEVKDYKVELEGVCFTEVPVIRVLMMCVK